MKVEDAIRRRRSIRDYARKRPGEKEIIKILEAARWAPSGLNNQPWKFKVLSGRPKTGLARFTESSDVIESAPAAICVFLDHSSSYNRQKDIMAVGACVQNMLLQAYGLGLGTCWLGEILNRREDVERYLKVNSGYELVAVVTVGYPGEKTARSRRRKLENLILK